MQRLVEIRLEEDLEVYLQREYCLKKRSLREVAADIEAAAEVEVHWGTVARWLGDFQLDRRTMSRKAAEEQVS